MISLHGTGLKLSPVPVHRDFPYHIVLKAHHLRSTYLNQPSIQYMYYARVNKNPTLKGFSPL